MPSQQLWLLRRAATAVAATSPTFFGVRAVEPLLLGGGRFFRGRHGSITAPPPPPSQQQRQRRLQQQQQRSRHHSTTTTTPPVATLAPKAAGFPDPPPQRPLRRVVITGIGLATPLGVGKDVVWERLLNGESGIRELTAEDVLEGEHGFNQMPVKVAAIVPRVGGGGDKDKDHRTDADADAARALFDVAKWCEGDVGRAPGSAAAAAAAASGSGSSDDGNGNGQPPPPAAPPAASAVGGGGRIAPFAGLALAAADEALSDAGWSSADVTEAQRRRAGVSIGSGMGHVGDLTNAGRLLERGRLRRISPFFVPRILVNMAAGHVSMKHCLRGPNHAAATACATGAHAIGDAFRAIQRGDADLMVAGGTESWYGNPSLSLSLSLSFFFFLG